MTLTRVSLILGFRQEETRSGKTVTLATILSCAVLNDGVGTTINRGNMMNKVKLIGLLLAAAQLAGCMTVLKGLSALGEAQQNNPQPYMQAPSYPTYTTPQVVQPQLSKPANRYYCNTIGNVTTCKEL